MTLINRLYKCMQRHPRGQFPPRCAIITVLAKACVDANLGTEFVLAVYGTLMRDTVIIRLVFLIHSSVSSSSLNFQPYPCCSLPV